ncbi:hypothetical protein LW81_077 [Lactococcus phage LW81]|uniref:Uncharacterized protein n=1 Tax=Lactococcus phage LW81 TaxID=1965482 RepID=A0A1W6JN79_9CAUD|nr:hypothetical protein H1Z34_gp077 [Lactococcus phage LW81]ARM67647.1 hypothetical protein LW81_077 [Lactococcus phage LW81]
MKTSHETLATLIFFIILFGMKISVGFEYAVLFGLAVAIVKVIKHGNG